jgi:hypothetical protein
MKFLFKLVCIEDFKGASLESELTFGKIYSASKFFTAKKMENSLVNPSHYFVINDSNMLSKYHSKYFVTIEEWRENQLNNII